MTRLLALEFIFRIPYIFQSINRRQMVKLIYEPTVFIKYYRNLFLRIADIAPFLCALLSWHARLLGRLQFARQPVQRMQETFITFLALLRQAIRERFQGVLVAVYVLIQYLCLQVHCLRHLIPIGDALGSLRHGWYTFRLQKRFQSASSFCHLVVKQNSSISMKCIASIIFKIFSLARHYNIHCNCIPRVSRKTS